jgi:hypothetical protein
LYRGKFLAAEATWKDAPVTTVSTP